MILGVRPGTLASMVPRLLRPPLHSTALRALGSLAEAAGARLHWQHADRAPAHSCWARAAQHMQWRPRDAASSPRHRRPRPLHVGACTCRAPCKRATRRCCDQRAPAAGHAAAPGIGELRRQRAGARGRTGSDQQDRGRCGRGRAVPADRTGGCRPAVRPAMRAVAGQLCVCVYGLVCRCVRASTRPVCDTASVALQLEKGLEDSARRRAAAHAIAFFCTSTRLDFQEHVPSLLTVRPSLRDGLCNGCAAGARFLRRSRRTALPSLGAPCSRW